MTPNNFITRAQAELVIDKARDPDWVWDSPEKGLALQVWQWAKANNLRDIQASIAEAATTAFSLQYRGKGIADWHAELFELAGQAKQDGRPQDYAGFIAGALLTGGFSQSQAAAFHEELYAIYSQLGEWSKAIERGCVLAGYRIRAGNFKQAAELLLRAYHSSRQHDFARGVIRALIGFGDLLETKDPLQACRFQYKAMTLAAEIRSPWGITALEKMRSTAEANNISRSDCEVSESADSIVSTFEKNLGYIFE